MKPKFLAFPLTIILASSAMAGQFVWTGATDSDWATATNWLLVSAGDPPVFPADPFPTLGGIYAGDFLNIRNNGDLTIDPPGTTPGFDAVYNPGAGVTTTFNNGRCFVIGTGNGPAATPANTKGYAKLIVTSGTIVGARTTNTGSEAYMANRADSTLLINGGNVNLSGQLNNFRLIQEGLTGITSTITIDSGSLSCRSLDLVFDTELDPATVFGTGIINLNGGTFTPLRITRTAASDPGQTNFTLNLNGGTLRPAATITTGEIFLAAVTDLSTVVKSGGAIIDTNTFNASIAEVLEHDTSGPAIDGGLTKNGAGTLTLSGTNTFTGPVTVNAGTALTTPSRISLPNDSAAGTGAITLADSYAEIQVNNTRNIANSITIANTGAEKTILLPSPGGGAFAGANFSGPIAINDTDIDHFRVRADDNCFLTFSGIVSGSGGIFKYQPGRLDLTNASNSFTGDVKITHGAISFTNGALGSTGQIRMEGASGVNGVTLRWDPTNDQDISSRLVMYPGKAATLVLADGGSPFDTSNVTFANAIGSGTTASLVKSGNGTLTLTQPSTYSGGTTITQGTLEFVNDGIGTTGTVTMDGGILRWSTGNTQDFSSRIVMVNAKTASFSTNGNDITFASAIGGTTSGNLTKTNTAGTLTLNGANTYSGITTVGGGTLKLGTATSLGYGGSQTTITNGTAINSGAVLDLNGSSVINEPITVNGTGGGNGALVNNSGTAASIGSGIAGIAMPATPNGTGYTSPPVVNISGTGTGATATASLGLTLASFTVGATGTKNYTAAPTVTISGGGGSSATATAVLTSGKVTGINLTNPGVGYTSAPTLTLSGGTVTTGTTDTPFTGNALNFTVIRVNMTAPGSGYTGTPTYTFSAGNAAPGTVTLSSATLATDSSVGGTGDTTINAVVSESGGARALTKVGAGTVTLNGANTYTGETIVDAGTLAISTDDTLANAAAVRIDSAAFLNLGFVGTDTVDRIFIGGVEQASGTWGSLLSSATNKTARITGTGILDVTNGAAPANDYTAWAASQIPPVTGGVSGDTDNDGVKNLIEYALTNGGERGVLSGNTITFTKRGAPYGGDVTYSIETSTDLGTWSTPGGGVTESGSAISFLFTPSTPVKNFARLKVVQVP